jgi:hypothetical protein
MVSSWVTFAVPERMIDGEDAAGLRACDRNAGVEEYE